MFASTWTASVALRVKPRHDGAMAEDLIGYGRLLEEAALSVVKRTLQIVAEQGLPGAHHFYITIKTSFPGVMMSHGLRTRFEDEMTIVLQHQYWSLQADDETFAVTLSFGGTQERLTIPYRAITRFFDPSVELILQFQVETEEPTPPQSPEPSPETPGVVSLADFKKKRS
jgi:hypothetical protein